MKRFFWGYVSPTLLHLPPGPIVVKSYKIKHIQSVNNAAGCAVKLAIKYNGKLTYSFKQYEMICVNAYNEQQRTLNEQ